MTHVLRLTSAVFLGLSLACSGGGTAGAGATGGGANNGGGGSGGIGGTGTGTYSSLTWTKTTIDAAALNPAGIQGKLLRASDGTLFYAYLQYDSGNPGLCSIAVFSNGSAPMVSHNLKVAVRSPGSTTWTVETVDLSSMAVPYITALFGIDGVINQQDQPVLVFAGGAGALYTCGSSDAVTATRTGTNAWTINNRQATSAACCGSECIDPQGCQAGVDGDVGHWSAIAQQADGSLAIAYADAHNFGVQDGMVFAGYEMWHEADGVFGIRPWSGSGQFGALVEASGTLISAFANFTGTGIRVYHRINNTASIFSWEATQPTMDYATANSQPPNEWDTDLLKTSKIGQRLSMEVASNGNIGIAAHVINTSGDADLMFCESTDGALNWTCEYVGDYRQSFGYFPSLVYDNEDRPVISCRACGIGGDCNNDRDGLRLFWRENDGTWDFANVDFDNRTKSGIYTSLVLDPTTNEPTIAHHNSTDGAAMIAQGRF